MSMTTNELRNRRRTHENEPPSSSAKDQASTRKLLTWDEIPQWQRDNEYIIYGYRGELNSWRRSFSSAFTYLHNETVNIQSHWIGGLVFIGMWLYHLRGVYKQYADTINTFDKLYMSFFMIGALFCLFISGSYHMISSHSKPVSDVFHRLDYAGIVILTVGSFYPAVYYGFFCDPHFAVLWLVLLTVSGAGAAYAVLSPTYSTPEYRRTRAYLFITLGLGGALPVIHLWAAEGFSHLIQIGIDWLLASAAFYIGGAILYSERFPERIWPGRFDLIGASHQIFHVCVVLAAICHYISMLRCIEFWHGEHHGHCGVFRE